MMTCADFQIFMLYLRCFLWDDLGYWLADISDIAFSVLIDEC